MHVSIPDTAVDCYTHSVPRMRCTLRKFVCGIRDCKLPVQSREEKTHSSNRWRHYNKKLWSLVRPPAHRIRGILLADINAHSPLYSVKIGRVVLMNAGAAKTAVAIPTFTAYLISGCFIRSPMAQSVCFTLPQKVRVDLSGVSTVFGACGRILGK